MRLLLDTHIALWFALDPELLTRGETELLGSAETEVLLSAVSIWELRLKWKSFHVSGARNGPAHPGQVLEALVEGGISLVSLTGKHAAAELEVPLSHSDPFDELLLVQSQEEGCRLLTRDARLTAHPLAMAA